MQDPAESSRACRQRPTGVLEHGLPEQRVRSTLVYAILTYDVFDGTVLDPTQKAKHLEKYWGIALTAEAKQRAEVIFKARHERLHEAAEANIELPPPSNSRHPTSASAKAHPAHPSPLRRRARTPLCSEPWREEFDGYLGAPERLNGKTIVQWWGLNAARYPVWASLARDYLSVMGSSVSAERAFSSAGITVSKRRNRLKGDIVEALQGLKCTIRRHLLFRDDASIQDEVCDAEESAETLTEAENGWDGLVADLEDSREGVSEVDDDLYMMSI
ncbi:hypothetical protein NUW54_g6121 [Trametes sanguinea]|uniref:Uncharacterized protein n=1 Tax=Trametes sanguinea TaxID=158606 RepID=A0ACC1PV95_9APHY|nr:hypothetical protein NUW54_g6121 [Trametes sanguinea]